MITFFLDTAIGSVLFFKFVAIEEQKVLYFERIVLYDQFPYSCF